jgi:cytochrome c-type biogenesis protein CcmH/NrfG
MAGVSVKNMDMNTELLSEINSALWILVYLVGAAVTFYVIKTIIVSNKEYRKLMENKFYETANVYFEDGEFNEVVRLSEEQIQKKPKDAYGYWFMGKAQYELGNHESALSNFNKAAEIHPSWVKEWVQPYYEKIENAKENANK